MVPRRPRRPTSPPKPAFIVLLHPVDQGGRWTGGQGPIFPKVREIGDELDLEVARLEAVEFAPLRQQDSSSVLSGFFHRAGKVMYPAEAVMAAAQLKVNWKACGSPPSKRSAWPEPAT